MMWVVNVNDPCSFVRASLLAYALELPYGGELVPLVVRVREAPGRTAFAVKRAVLRGEPAACLGRRFAGLRVAA